MTIGLWVAASATYLTLLLIGTSRLLYPYDTGHYEAGVWEPALMLSQGSNPYDFRETVEPPYVACPYGPAYYGMIGLGLRCFGPQFWTGRLLSLLSILACSACIWMLIWRFTRNRNLALLSIIIFAIQFPVQHWSGIQKPDFPGLAFGLFGLLLGLRTGTIAQTCLYTLGAGSMFALSVFCRQTSVLPLVILSLWFGVNRMYGSFLLLALSFVSLFFLVSVPLNLTSDNGFLWQMYFLPSSVSRSTAQFMVSVMGLASSPATWIVGIIILLSPLKRWLVESSPTSESASKQYVRVLWCYLVLSLLLGGITCSRVGSNLNYWLETCAVVSLLIPVACGELIFSRRQAVTIASRLVVLSLVVAGVFMGLRVLRGELFSWQAAPYFEEIAHSITENCPPGEPCFSVYPELVAYAGRDYYFNDFVQYDGRSIQLRKAFESAVNERVFAVMVTHESVPPPGYRSVSLVHSPPARYYHCFLHRRN